MAGRNESRRWGLNPRPLVYETSALPLSYTGDKTVASCETPSCEDTHARSELVASCEAPASATTTHPLATRRLATVLSSALGRTRTGTDFSTTPSRWRVYQFHHQGDGGES